MTQLVLLFSLTLHLSVDNVTEIHTEDKLIPMQFKKWREKAHKSEEVRRRE